MEIELLLIVYVSYILHEVGHYIAAKLLKIRILCFKIGLFGVNMQMNLSDVDSKNKIFIYFAGPAVNLILTLVAYMYKLNNVYKMNLGLCLLNLIPIVPLDGGNTLKTVFEMIFKRDFVIRLYILINIVFLLISVLCLIKDGSVIYFALIFINIKGLFGEIHTLKYDKLINTYKKNF